MNIMLNGFDGLTCMLGQLKCPLKTKPVDNLKYKASPTIAFFSEEIYHHCTTQNYIQIKIMLAYYAC